MERLFIYSRIGLLFFTFFLLGLKADSQSQASNERIDKVRKAFISQQLNLTPVESEKFWPIYSSFRSEFEMLPGNYSGLELEQRKLDLKRKYKPLFEGVLGAERVSRF